jgi:hypothetical protein
MTRYLFLNPESRFSALFDILVSLWSLYKKFLNVLFFSSKSSSKETISTQFKSSAWAACGSCRNSLTVMRNLLHHQFNGSLSHRD